MESPRTGIEISLTRASYGIRGTASVRCGVIPAYQGNSGEAIATIFFEGKPTHFIAARMEGGQVLLLPEEITLRMLEALKSDQPFVLYLDGYETYVTTRRFCSAWNHIK
jgi:hypothetical protein